MIACMFKFRKKLAIASVDGLGTRSQSDFLQTNSLVGIKPKAAVTGNMVISGHKLVYTY